MAHALGVLRAFRTPDFALFLLRFRLLPRIRSLGLFLAKPQIAPRFRTTANYTALPGCPAKYFTQNQKRHAYTHALFYRAVNLAPGVARNGAV